MSNRRRVEVKIHADQDRDEYDYINAAEGLVMLVLALDRVRARHIQRGTGRGEAQRCTLDGFVHALRGKDPKQMETLGYLLGLLTTPIPQRANVAIPAVTHIAQPSRLVH